MELFAVVFTDNDEESTEHSAWLTREDAERHGAELARNVWDRDNEGEPFPDDDDIRTDADVMDVGRTECDIRLEVEPISISGDVVRALYALLADAME